MKRFVTSAQFQEVILLHQSNDVTLDFFLANFVLFQKTQTKHFPYRLFLLKSKILDCAPGCSPVSQVRRDSTRHNSLEHLDWPIVVVAQVIMKNVMFKTRITIFNFSKKDTQSTCSERQSEKQVLSQCFGVLLEALCSFKNFQNNYCVLFFLQ